MSRPMNAPIGVNVTAKDVHRAAPAADVPAPTGRLTALLREGEAQRNAVTPNPLGGAT